MLAGFMYSPLLPLDPFWNLSKILLSKTLDSVPASPFRLLRFGRTCHDRK